MQVQYAMVILKLKSPGFVSKRPGQWLIIPWKPGQVQEIEKGRNPGMLLKKPTAMALSFKTSCRKISKNKWKPAGCKRNLHAMR